MSGRRIVFMGTPAFAAASLKALIDAGLEIAAVVTAPDRPAGRGQQLRMSAVKVLAMEYAQLKERILQPEKLKDASFLDQLDQAKADLYVVVAFRMLPEVVWRKAPLGTINLHGSLLPDYRGAAPINWAIINGEERTGVTTFFIRHEIDTGDMIASETTTIGIEETAGELHDRLMHIGASLIVRSVQQVLNGEVHPIPQPSIGAMHAAPKLTPANCRIDWKESAQRVHDHIRGLSPFPGAWTELVMDERAPQHFKILRARPAAITSEEMTGQVVIKEGRLFIICGADAIEALEVQAEGKRRMDAASFLRGLQGEPFLRFL